MTRRSFARRGFLTGDFSIDRDETGLLELLDGDLGTDGPVTFVAANQREVEERARRVSTPFVPWTRGILLYLSLRCQAWSSQGRTAATRPATKRRPSRKGTWACGAYRSITYPCAPSRRSSWRQGA